LSIGVASVERAWVPKSMSVALMVCTSQDSVMTILTWNCVASVAARAALGREAANRPANR
jgi:hypothetical protein